MSDQEHESRPMAVPTVQFESESLLVTEWRFPPGGRTGWHVHAYDYAVVPMTTGELSIETHDGSVTSHLTAGQSYGRPKGAEHDVINTNTFEFVFIEIEAKR